MIARVEAMSFAYRQINRQNEARSISNRSPRLLEIVGDFVLELINTCSFHGFKYLVQPSLHPLERLTWSGAALLALWGAATISFSTWNRFQQNPTVLSMERNYKDWNTSFPAVTICPSPSYDQDNLVKMVNHQFPEISDKKAAIEFLKQLSNASFGTFAEVRTKNEEIDPSKYWEAVWKVAFPFRYNVTNSNAEAYNQTELSQVVTEAGICYSYNSLATVYQDPKKWERKEWHLVPEVEVFKSSPLDGDIFAQIMNMNAGYRVPFIVSS